MKKSSNLILLRVFVFALVSSLLACNKGSIGLESSAVDPVSVKDPVSVNNGRLSFSNSEEFNKTLNKLRQLNTEEEIAEWEKGYNFYSLRKHDIDHRSDEQKDNLDLPTVFKAVLNEKAEYSIGDTIVWYDKEYTYFIPKNDEQLLKSVKNDPNTYKEKHKIEVSVSPVKSNPNARSGPFATLYPNGDPDARNQLEWAPDGQSGRWRKTVYELYSYCISSTPNGRETGVNIRIKLEWWSSGNHWQSDAGEPMNVAFNVYGTIYIDNNTIGSFYTAPISANHGINNPFTYYSNFQVEKSLYIIYNDHINLFEVELNGYINSSVKWDNGVVQNNSIFNIASDQYSRLW